MRSLPRTVQLARFVAVVVVGPLLVACGPAAVSPTPPASVAVSSPLLTASPQPTQAPANSPTPSPSEAAASAPAKGAFHLEKTCVGSVCTVTASSYSGIPAGTTITYDGSSNDALTASIKVTGGTATGQCNIATLPGKCTFTKGTGTLATFRENVVVTQDATGLWSWDGPVAP